jgi:serine protease Do
MSAVVMNMKALTIFCLAGVAIAIGFANTRSELPAETVEDLKDKQAQIKAVIQSTMPATVAVADGIGSGSGVIVSEDGLILTAAHVLMTEGADNFEITFPDGRKVTATPLGRNLDVDAGMLKIDQEGPWPYVPLGDMTEVKPGDWCVGLGYPGGYQLGRTPPVRVGRILANATTVVMSDSALIGGDSGGPLFNLDGEVIGIHSSIGASVDQNRHVPVALFQRDWDQLLSGETWGRLGSQVELNPNRPMLGIQMQQNEASTSISGVIQDSPADLAGLQIGDLLIAVDDVEVTRPIDVIAAVSRKEAGDEVEVRIEREGQELSKTIVLTRKSDLNLQRE